MKTKNTRKRTRKPFPGNLRRAIESNDFPFEHLSAIAELESWRKEVNRPIYHIHKWWAQRLGSVFRAILIASFADESADILADFYSVARLTNAVIFDPFMGSGTTVGEALKLGARAIGRDINPVAELVVRSAMQRYTRSDVVSEFASVEKDVAPTIRSFYRAHTQDDQTADVLYYFWVKYLDCPSCNTKVDLFSSYIFSRHAYPSRFPLARAVCPCCGAICETRHDSVSAQCTTCHTSFDPQRGPAHGQKATCPLCRHEFPIARTAKSKGCPPSHRIYAKMLLMPNGTKSYVATEPFDLELYSEATRQLSRFDKSLPDIPIEPGYNTNQVLNYGYTSWRQMFNNRQLLCLSLLFERLKQIRDDGIRQLLEVHLSGVLEFNNLFASFKGEGTGAVRHMFSHHILKPERTPLEANVWGTPKSSGSFSTLFSSRILRALDYRESPFEIRPTQTNGKALAEKVYGLSERIGVQPATTYAEFENGKPLYLSCGDSSSTDIASESVDAVVTDPPFFDNVHYSQLADFFYVWLRRAGHDITNDRQTTRSDREVQSTDSAQFAERLSAVFLECARVLKQNGLLVFTYHHSRNEGWACVLHALAEAGFFVSAVQPVKAEMSVAAPKSQAAEPIDLDVIIVCRKRLGNLGEAELFPIVLMKAVGEAERQIQRFNATGRKLSRNDVRVVVMSHVVKHLSKAKTIDTESLLDTTMCDCEIANLYDGQTITDVA